MSPYARTSPAGAWMITGLLATLGCTDAERFAAAICTEGALTCPCKSDGTCDDNDYGIPLTCKGGRCLCTAGTTGCLCAGDSCMAGSVCTDVGGGVRKCLAPEYCPRGTEGCPCYEDASCDDDPTGSPMQCKGGACAKAGCQPGAHECPCLPGFQCAEAGDVCWSGLCVKDTGQPLIPPPDARCYSPCREGLETTNGTFLPCDVDGLIATCVGDSTCVNGSCLSPEERDLGWKTSTACSFDSHCPDFQACVQGHCYSTCELDEDCRLGRECHRKTCRVRCTGVGNECGHGEFCRTEDGQSGFCMPLVVRKSAKAPAGVLASTVARRSQFTAAVPTGPSGTGQTLRLSDAQKIGRIDLTNTGTQSVTLTIQPTEHTTFPASGPITIRAPAEAAIPWATLTSFIGESQVSQATGGQAVTLTLEPQQSGHVTLSRRQGSEYVAVSPGDTSLPAFVRWEGRLSVRADDNAEREIRLSFARSPRGRWAGTVSYFADFGDVGLDAWIAAGKPGGPSADYVGNALVQKWVAVKDQEITLAEFREILRATEEGSWRNPILQGRCPTAIEPLAHHACYPTSVGSGVGHYSSDSDLWPVPAGVVSMPFSAWIGPGKSAAEWAGRVDSSEALHYTGNPEFSLSFQGDPSTCPAGTCTIPITALRVQSWVGGREPAANGTCGAGYELVEVPWLVPLFDEGTAVDPTDGTRYKLWCHDPRWPLKGSKDGPLNVSLSGANPFPDGRTLQRELVLVDGAVIDQQEIFAIVREELPSFVPSCVPSSSSACAGATTEKVYRYGYLLLTRTPEPAPDEAFKPGVAPAVEAPVIPQPTCTDDMVQRVFPGQTFASLGNQEVATLGVAMVTGTVPPNSPPVPSGAAHYLCPSTDRFDGACPPSQLPELQFFVAPTLANLQNHPCGNSVCEAGEPCTQPHCGPPCAPGEACAPHPMSDCGQCDTGGVCRSCTQGSCSTAGTVGACRAQLDKWLASPSLSITPGPACNCKSSVAACHTACGGDYSDLRNDRVFYNAPGPTLPPGPSPTEVEGTVLWPHYLCHETGHIDLGPSGTKDCPETSAVTWFFLAKDDAAVRALPCQVTPGTCLAGDACGVTTVNPDGTLLQAACAVGASCAAKGSCVETVRGLEAAPGSSGYLEIHGWECAAPGDINCTWPAGGGDLRSNKRFFRPTSAEVVFNTFDNALDDGFRYKSRFRTRSGANVGFAPDACVDGANPIPYCYDATGIDELRLRVDCAAAVYTQRYHQLSSAGRATLRRFLDATFADRQELVAGEPFPTSHAGFEQLYAELLVMLGDESVTAAYASRFDVSGDKIADFRGSRFEPNGIDLGGKPGFEMYGLYQGVEYYDLVLQRFFGHAATLGESLDLIDGNPNAGDGPPQGEGFLDYRAAATYLPRVARASTRKANALAEIATRYNGFNRTDLARHVVERAFLSTYLESVVILQFMDRLTLSASSEKRDGVRKEKVTRQLEYDQALRKLRALYDGFTPEPTFFGIPANFVPIPPMDTLEVNIQAVNTFDVAFAAAKEAFEVSRESELIALAEKRAFDTDKEEFKSALFELIGQFEGDASTLCGTFVGDDGGIYAATIANKEHSAATRGMDDPCGRTGNGDLHNAMLDLEAQAVAAQQVRLRMANTSAATRDLQSRLNAQCARIGTLKDDLAEITQTIAGLETGLATAGAAVDALDRTYATMETFREGSSCAPPSPPPAVAPGTCATQLAALATFGGVMVGLSVAASVTDIATQAVFTASIGAKQVEQVKKETEAECEALKIDTKFDILDKGREFEEIKLDAKSAEIELRRAGDNVRGLRNDAAGLLSGLEEHKQNLINIEAAHNDPNVRIFKNAAMENADKHFYRALTKAYVATRVYEYYTSTSYAAKDELTLVRLAAVGENNLQNYLLDLEDAFTDFEYIWGQPDLRLHIVSLRDDIVPMMEANTAMTLEERKAAFHEALTDVARRDDRGWITLPFSTGLRKVSPITANHKLLYMEAELVGRDLGDALGRVYVRQLGTGTIREVEGGQLANHVFPPATAVINTLFNGRRGSDTMEFNPSLYRAWRLRDRPLINTQWQLILNTRDEEVNRDIDLDGLQDIVLYVYYTDFTTLDSLQ